MEDKKYKYILVIVLVLFVGYMFYQQGRQTEKLFEENERLSGLIESQSEEFADLKSRIDFVTDEVCSMTSINRKPEEKYKDYDYSKWVTVFYKKDKYFHANDECPFIVSDKERTDMLDMSRYEAVDRGFQPCPECFYAVVDAR